MGMSTPAFVEREDRLAASKTPHLSFSRLNKYLHCPEQYRLYYVENLRPSHAAANLVFGQVLHQALAALFRDRADPLLAFERTWAEAHDFDLQYSLRESWQTLHDKGRVLLEKFLSEEVRRIGSVTSAEKPFEIKITSLGWPFIGVIDLVAEVDGLHTVVDFKTSGSSYEDYEVILSDQLTAYQLAVPDAQATALCVFVKTKEPRIEWHLSVRTGKRLTEFLDKAEYLASQIQAARFYKRPGKWCAWCDYLPVCTGDKRTAEETLIQIQ
jgi:putative RecB family exonuclease